MKVISCRVANYKSFHRPGKSPIAFDPGFNILVGRNNVGKTALLEALSLRFADSPHRSLISAARASDVLPPASRVEVTYSVAGTEVAEVLDSTQDVVSIPFPANSNQQPEAAGEEAFRQLTTGTLTLNARFEGGSLRVVEALQRPYVAAPIDSGLCAAFSREGTDQRWGFRGTTGSDGRRLEYRLAVALQARVYSFRAERMNVGVCGVGTNPILNPDAGNLPEVLNLLQTQNPRRFKRYNELVSRVFPNICWVGVSLASPSQLEVFVWEHDLDTERQDLAVSLRQSGTGISQVLAMLYVIVTAETDRVFIIDEPNSFLHPGAVRSLLEILREHPRHQYVISTHSPQTIAGLGADARIQLLRKNKDNATCVIQVNQAETAQVREVLAEVGARISDVFGAESVLWVEGATEEQCFRIIVEEVLRLPLRSIAIVGVRHTADFDRRDARWALELYGRVSEAGPLMPPAIGFIFDREARSGKEIEDITRQSRGAVTFLPVRMYENYLLRADAIASVLGSRNVTVPVERVAEQLAARRLDPVYYPRGDISDASAVHGGSVLRDLFAEISGGTVEYGKVQDGIALTKWLTEHDPSALADVAAVLREKLVRSGDLGRSD